MFVDGLTNLAVGWAAVASWNCRHPGIEQLDKLLNTVDNSVGSLTLEPLRKALRSKGGARNQARAVHRQQG